MQVSFVQKNDNCALILLVHLSCLVRNVSIIPDDVQVRYAYQFN